MILMENGHITLRFVLGRSISGFLITTAIPVVLANTLGFATTFFSDKEFETAIGVNLTIMLVITTM